MVFLAGFWTLIASLTRTRFDDGMARCDEKSCSRYPPLCKPEVDTFFVIPANAGTQFFHAVCLLGWVPAFAGMTKVEEGMTIKGQDVIT